MGGGGGGGRKGCMRKKQIVVRYTVGYIGRRYDLSINSVTNTTTPQQGGQQSRVTTSPPHAPVNSLRNNGAAIKAFLPYQRAPLSHGSDPGLNGLLTTDASSHTEQVGSDKSALPVKRTDKLLHNGNERAPSDGFGLSNWPSDEG